MCLAFSWWVTLKRKPPSPSWETVTNNYGLDSSRIIGIFWNIRELWIELKSYVPPRKLQVGKTVRVQFWGWKERNSTSKALKNASSMWFKDVHHMDLNGSAFREQWHQRVILNFWSPMSPGSGRGSKRPEINFPAFIMLASVFILVLIPRSSFSKDPLKKITSNTQMTLFIYMND